MVTHVKVLGVLHIVFGALGTIAGIVVLTFFGGLAGLVTFSERTALSIAAPVLGGLGSILFLIVLVFSLPSLITGIGLLNFQPWSRIVMIVLSALHLFHPPFGTALGIYGLWVLLNRQTEALFSRPAIRTPI